MRCLKKLGLSSITELQHKGQFLYIVPGVYSSCHPLLTSSSLADVQQRDTDVLKHLAEEFNLTYKAFGSAISTQDGLAAGTLILSEAWYTGLEPAPVTPSDEDSAPWRLFSGTIKATYNAHRNLDGPNNIVVSPGIMSGNSGGYTRLVPCVQRKH